MSGYTFDELDIAEGVGRFNVHDESVPDTDAPRNKGVDDPSDNYDTPTPIRVNGGLLDFLNDIVEGIQEYLDVSEVTGDVPVPKRSQIRTINVRDTGSDTWRAGTKYVNGTDAVYVVTDSSFRRRVTVVNHGPDTVYLSKMTPSVGQTPPSPNQIQLPPVSATLWAPLSLQTKDEVWAVCATGEEATLSVIEEFDME